MSSAGQSRRKQTKTREETLAWNDSSFKNWAKEVKSFPVPAPQLQREHEQHVERSIIDSTDTQSKFPRPSRADKQFWSGVHASATPSPCACTSAVLSTKLWLFVHVDTLHAYEQTGWAGLSTYTYVTTDKKLVSISCWAGVQRESFSPEEE